MTSAPLHVDMDALKIGPAGQTLGELKQSVRDAREALRAELASGRGARADLVDASFDATRMLRAAYVRLGLPYKTP
jgi:hypothetical protein